MVVFIMLKITFVIPYYDLQETVEKYLSRARHRNVVFDTTHIVGVEDVKKLKFDCDIIIARGITCDALRKFHKDITVVEIPVTGYDVISALDECKRRFGARRIAVIGSGNMVMGSPSLNNILDIEVLVYPVEQETDAEEHIQSALDRGVEAIVGGLMTYNFALKRGLRCTWIKSGEDAIRQAAAIAAWYSKHRKAKNVPVAWTEKKYVRKPKGAPAGTVIMEREKVIMVQPMLPPGAAEE